MPIQRRFSPPVRPPPGQVVQRIAYQYGQIAVINPDGSYYVQQAAGWQWMSSNADYLPPAAYLDPNMPMTMLVHGSIQGFGHPRLAHAWIKLQNGTVWEPATNKVWSRSAFEGFFNPRVDRKYENRRALEHMVRHEHWGPWHHAQPVQQSA